MVYLFLSGGLKLYEMLYANLPVPHARTITRFIEKYDSAMEGELQLEQLNQFLHENHYPKKIWISEDGTKIVDKILYNDRHNNMVGIVLPFDENGMPILNQYKVNTALDIKLFMTKEKASILYIVMAKPICKNSKAFCLCYFGTTNKFRTDHVLKRWLFMEEKLKDYGIEVCGYSADGDSRLLKAMRILSVLPSVNVINTDMPMSWRTWYCARFKSERPICIQDTVHLGAKFRTRVLKKAKPLKIGKFQN
jgi:hypothetical protein